MKDVHIKTIPHKSQRYPTCGDYFDDIAGNLVIKVSELPDEDFEFCIAIHELIESYLCAKRGISEPSITAFDIEFERRRKKGNVDEPGDDPKAPYFKEHQFSTKIEKLMAKELKVSWKKYTDAVNSL